MQNVMSVFHRHGQCMLCVFTFRRAGESTKINWPVDCYLNECGRAMARKHNVCTSLNDCRDVARLVRLLPSTLRPRTPPVRRTTINFFPPAFPPPLPLWPPPPLPPPPDLAPPLPPPPPPVLAPEFAFFTAGDWDLAAKPPEDMSLPPVAYEYVSSAPQRSKSTRRLLFLPGCSECERRQIRWFFPF